jgi:hypothetical protein
MHKKPEFDSVPTPEWFLSLFAGFHDPFPLGCDAPVESATRRKGFC